MNHFNHIKNKRLRVTTPGPDALVLTGGFDASGNVCPRLAAIVPECLHVLSAMYLRNVDTWNPVSIVGLLLRFLQGQPSLLYHVSLLSISQYD